VSRQPCADPCLNHTPEALSLFREGPQAEPVRRMETPRHAQADLDAEAQGRSEVVEGVGVLVSDKTNGTEMSSWMRGDGAALVRQSLTSHGVITWLLWFGAGPDTVEELADLGG